jgi:hypothetical protein
MRTGFSIDQEFAVIRMVRTAKHLDQSRFAGAVLSNKYVHFAAVCFQRNVIQRTNTVNDLEIPRISTSGAKSTFMSGRLYQTDPSRDEAPGERRFTKKERHFSGIRRRNTIF